MQTTHNIPSVRQQIKGRIRKINKETRAATKRVVRKSRMRLKKATPRKWSGETKKSWDVKKIGHQPPSYSIYTNSMVAYFVNYGTKRRVARRKPRLWLPRTKRAWQGGYQKGMKWGRDFVMKKSVRGIRPRKFVEKEIPSIRKMLRSALIRVVVNNRF